MWIASDNGDGIRTGVWIIDCGEAGGVEERDSVERIKGPQDNIPSLSLELAPTGGGELVVIEQSPELSRGLTHASNALDEIVLKLAIVNSVVRETKVLRRLVEGCCCCTSWLRIGIGVCTVTDVCTSRGRGYGSRTANNEVFKNCRFRTFDTKVDTCLAKISRTRVTPQNSLSRC